MALGTPDIYRDKLQGPFPTREKAEAEVEQRRARGEELVEDD